MPAETTTSRLSPWQIRKILHHVEANLADDMTVADLAGLLGLSDGYFSRAFHASLGTRRTPSSSIAASHGRWRCCRLRRAGCPRSRRVATSATSCT